MGLFVYLTIKGLVFRFLSQCLAKRGRLWGTFNMDRYTEHGQNKSSFSGGCFV